MPIDIKSLSYEELLETMPALGEKAFRGKQLYEWMHVHLARSYEDMKNIPKTLKEKMEAECVYTSLTVEDCQISAIDGTRKYLFQVSCPVAGQNEESCVEAVMIPDQDRKTLCVSSQAGCKMSCKFCMTGRQGFHGNLSAADILNQFFAIEEAGEITNAVFMGMGEPLDNWEEVKRAIEVLTAPWGLAWSPKRITLSTIGVLPNLKKFLDESRCHLAVSLHNPFPEERLQMMPVQKAWPLEDVINLIRQYDFTGQRRVSFEYTVFSGWNDTKRHADALLRLLQGLECRVNLIRFHRIPDFPYGPAPLEQMEAFRDRLSRGGITATIRASRGEDIFAACGLLAGKHKEQ